ncbi:MAG TPA: FAD-dependent monooxygenase [Gemmatimonadales bacterium]|nr:FAD-dependent monooxygenase [Gemmatimonadales bacterium]
MGDLWTDVLIVGAGPAGSASAAFLAQSGLHVVAVDRAAFPRDKACSEYLSPEAVRVLDRLGVVPDLERAGARPLGGTIVLGPRGARLHGLFAEARSASNRTTGLSLPRTVLDARLVDAARDAGATVMEQTVLEELLYDGGSVAGAVVRERGRRRLIRSRLVVGADGLRSVVAQRLGVRRTGRLRRFAFVAHVEGVSGLEDSAEMHVGQDGYVGLNRITAELTNVALVVPAASVRTARGRSTAFFFDGLERFPGVRGRVDPRRVKRALLVTGPFASWSRRSIAAGALLVGDAADFFDPFTGEGISAALRGSELVADHAAAALATPGPIDIRRLEPYAVARRRAFAGKWVVERLIGHAMRWPALFDRAVERLGRRAGMAHTLIGVTGDIVPASAVLNPLFLARTVL